MNIAFVPIDNRPVCYNLPLDISKISDGINLYVPKREYLGDLTKPSNVDEIFNWLENLKNIDIIILSLDTIAYGGLINSRRSNDSFDTIKSRIQKLKKTLQGKKIYAFSSIMRISNNNINEEEKEYWSDYGKKIFEYSYNFHKNNISQTDIPQEILQDYLNTRKRNFEINKIYLDWQKEGFFKTLVFSKDDCSEYGLNVMESKELQSLGGFVKTGADEIPLTLLARAINEYKNQKIKIAPIFTEPDYKDLISNYEDISIEQSVKGQIELAGCEYTNPDDADVIMYVNNFKTRQGEIVMKIPTEPYNAKLQIPKKPYIIADVRYANGADNEFVKEIFKNGFDNNFLGYSAWNTSANTLGSLICVMSVSLQNRNETEFKKLQITRFLDDWAYQANVRQMLSIPDTKLCKELMKPFEEKLWQAFNVKCNVEYIFPWNRLFEIEII